MVEVASLHVVVVEAYLEAALTFVVVVVALHLLGVVVVVPLPSQEEAPYPKEEVAFQESLVVVVAACWVEVVLVVV